MRRSWQLRRTLEIFAKKPYNWIMFDFAEKRPSEIPLVVLDTETTGLHPEMGHRVVEIGAVRFENWQEVGQLNTLLFPDRKMDAGASRVNGITDGDLAGQPTFAQFSDTLLTFLEGAVVVAHNARFDANFLGMEFYIQGIQAQKPPFKLENPWLCTFQLAKNCFHFGGNSLGNIARQYGVRTGLAHRALADVYTTAKILQRMTQELGKQNLTTVGDLLYAQGGSIFTPDPPHVTLPEEIEIGLQDGRFLHISYQSSTRNRSERTITPLYATQLNNAPYLIAYCHSSQEQRTFKIDRIRKIELA